jgi:predicted transcriptional regulator
MTDIIQTSQRTRTVPSEFSGRGQLLTPGEVASLLRVTPRTVSRYAKAGRLQRVVLSPRASRYTAESVAALMGGTPR